MFLQGRVASARLERTCLPTKLDFKRYLGSEVLQTVENAVSVGVSKHKYQRRVLQSLDPSTLAFQRQNTFEASNTTRLRFHQTDNDNIQIYPQSVRGRSVFPESTRGVLYYHVDPLLPAVAGEVRFRLCDSLEGFDKGSDLHVLKLPWAVSLPRIALVDEYAPLRKLLLKEGLVDFQLMSELSRLSRLPFDQSMLFYIGQPFIADLGSHWLQIQLVTSKSIRTVKFSNLFTDRRKPSQPVIYNGLVKARWELSDLPEHKSRGPTLVLRILDVVTEIKNLIPGYDGALVKPKPGHLLQRNPRLRSQPKVWAYPLNKRVYGAIIKDFIAATSNYG